MRRFAAIHTMQEAASRGREGQSRTVDAVSCAPSTVETQQTGTILIDKSSTEESNESTTAGGNQRDCRTSDITAVVSARFAEELTSSITAEPLR